MKINLIALINLISKLGFRNSLGQLEIRIIRNLILILLISLIFNLNSTPVSASSFTSASLILNNQTPNTALSGTVCAQASSAGAGTESQVIITFPSDFTVSANTANWTTGAGNLPSGATIWPGIGSTASSVSGRSVTFSSGDLTSTTLYCFNFTGAESTTGNTGDDKTGTIITKNSSSATIDSTTYAISIITGNQIGISATIPPTTSHLPISIESTTTGSNFPQNTTLDYKITYGLLTEVAFPLTIRAQWSQGTIAGSPTPSVDILSYVVGSASNAYGSTPAVVDTVNRTITWTISSFPANTTNQTVTFKLKTNDSYTGGNSVGFDVSTRAVSESTTTPDQTVSQNYLYDASLVPTATPTPTSAPSNSTTTTPTPTPTVTPAPTLQPLIFSNISVYSISKSNAQVSILTNNNSTLAVNYGLTPGSLSKKIISLSSQTQALIDLPDLQPDTNYYFEVTAKDSLGNSVKSGIFTFKTAVVSEMPTVNITTLVATSNNNILTSPLPKALVTEKVNSIIVIPTSSEFSIQLALTKITLIKSVQVFIVNKKVLGVNTFQANSAGSNYVNLVEIRPGVYTGKLLSKPNPGNYEIYARIIDYYGNITIQKLADLNIVNKLTVLTKDTGKPIENARVLFYLYNPASKTYKIISPSILPLSNPYFSLTDGTINVTLPQGKYKAEISAIGYKNQSVEFAIAPQSGYPTVYLTPSANVLTMAQYYLSTLSDTFISNQIFFRQQTQSNRLFDLLTLIAILAFVFITLLSFSAKTHIPFFDLPYFLIYKTKLVFLKDKSAIIQGKITDEANMNISKALISIIDPLENKLLFSAKTNKFGQFYFQKPVIENFKITVAKKGFNERSVQYIKQNSKILQLTMERTSGARYTLLEKILLGFEKALGLLFELLLVTSLLLEIFFIFTFGFLRTAPFLLISSVNVLLLFLFLYNNIKEEIEVELLNKSETRI